MNEKGMAITTVVYSIIILLSISMFAVLALARNAYDNEKSFDKDVNEILNDCLKENTCFQEVK